MTAPASAILVHGSWHGPETWDHVRPLLEGRGVQVVAPSLPSCGGTDGAYGDMFADAAVIARAIAAATGPAVVVGHSYAGVPVTQAAASGDVSHVVYLAAFVPDEGESVYGLLGQAAPEEVLVAPGKGLTLRDDGTHLIDLDTAPMTLYHDVEPALAAAEIARLRPQAQVAGSQEPTAIAWRTVPSTYVVCNDDRTIAPGLQRRMARHAASVVEWPTSHSPMLSRPELLAELVAELAGA